MAEFIDPNEIFFTPFEPKLNNRFIMEIDGIPAYLVKTLERPTVTSEVVTLDHINVKRYTKGNDKMYYYNFNTKCLTIM